MYKDKPNHYGGSGGMNPMVLLGGMCVFMIMFGQMWMMYSMVNAQNGGYRGGDRLPQGELPVMNDPAERKYQRDQVELREMEEERDTAVLAAQAEADAALKKQREEQESIMQLLLQQQELMAAQTAQMKAVEAASPHAGVGTGVDAEPNRPLTDEEMYPPRHPTKRIAIIVPYYGDKFATWFTIFTESARRSQFLYDWLLFYDGHGVPPPEERLPPNVIFYKVPSLSQLFAEGFSRELQLPLGPIADDFKLSLEKWPRTIAEYKPALGSVFADYLKGYSHWGYGDVDVIFGDLPGFTEKEDIEDFDIVTYTQGDDPRLYLRGQLTFFKNNPQVTVLWKGCPHFSSEFLQELKKKTGDKWSFNSAEGCISFVVGTNPYLSIKYAHKGLSEIGDTGARKDQRIVLQNGRVYRCFEDNLHLTPAPAVGPGGCPDTAVGNEGRHSVMGGELLQGKGELVPASWEPDFEKNNCHVYWVSFKYRLCLAKDAVPTARYHVKIINGQVYTQLVPSDQHALRRRVCEEGAFFHFQGSKKRLAEYYENGWHPPIDPCKRYKYYKEGLMEIDEEGNSVGTWGGGDHTQHDHKGF